MLLVAGMHTLRSWIIFLLNAFIHQTLTGFSRFYLPLCFCHTMHTLYINCFLHHLTA